MTKFVHSADWQLGMTRHFLSDEAQARFSGARIDAIRTLGALAVAESCAFVVVCGDVFESNQVSGAVIVRAFDAMAATPDVTFYLLPGNHDPLDASSVYRSSRFVAYKPDNVVVLDESGPVEVEAGVELVPAPWFSKRPLSDLVSDACESLASSDVLRIVAGHGALDSLSPNPDDPALIVLDALEQQIDGGLVHFVALGDRHSTTDAGRTGRVWYSGAPEPTNYTEVKPGNVLVVELAADDVNVDVHSVGEWKFLQKDFDLTGDADIDVLEMWLSEIEDKERTIVKLALVGQLTLAEKVRLDGVLEHHVDLLAALETWERRSELVVLPDAADLDHLQLSGFADAAMDDLNESAGSGDEAQAEVARDALALLYRLVEAAR